MSLSYRFGLGFDVGDRARADWRAAYSVGDAQPLWVFDFRRGRYGGSKPVPLSAMAQFDRASSATYFNAAGALVTAPTDALRITHDPRDQSALGVLIEGTTTNLLHDAVATAALWRGSVSGTDLSLGALGYFGGVSLASGGAKWHRATIDNLTLKAGVQYSVTLFFKLGTSGQFRMDFRNSTTGATSQLRNRPDDVEIALGAGSYAGVSVDMLRDGVYRLTAQFMPDVTGTYGLNFGPNSAVAGETVIGLGAQVEMGPVASSFYPGNSTSTVRAADQIGVLGIDGTYDVIATDGAGMETILRNEAITDGWWPSMTAPTMASLRVFAAGTLAA